MSKHVGRPSNEELIRNGKLVVSKRCKVCQSAVRDEITRDLLNNIPYTQIIAKYADEYFNGKLTPTNLHSHKQHTSPETAVQEDRKKALVCTTGYDDTTKALWQQKYSENFDKVRAADILYKQRLTNLFHIQNEIELLNQKEATEEGLDEGDRALRVRLVASLEEAYRGFNQDLLKHIQLDADLYVKQVNVKFVNDLKHAFIRFTQKFMDVLVKEVEDQLTRERVVDQLGSLLDQEIKPTLDPNKTVEAEFKVIDEDEKENK